MLLQGEIPVDYSANNGEALRSLYVHICDILKSVGNTVGSRRSSLSSSDWAYIAGFFDGDGSLMVQIKNRRDTSRGWRIMFTICFYQDSRHKKPLQWMRDIFGIGYLHDRSDGITELRINGYNQIEKILKTMQPYVRFKKRQVTLALNMLGMLNQKSFLSLSLKQRSQLADWFNELRDANYKSSQRRFSPAMIKTLLTK